MTAGQRLRVLHLINGLGTGGAERSLAQMLPLLADRVIDSTVVCLYQRTEGVHAEVEHAGWDVRVLSKSSTVGRVVELRRTLGEVRPDLVHTTLFESDVTGRLATLGTGVPVVSSLVNVSYEPVRLGDPNVKRHRLRLLQAVDSVTARTRNRGFHAISEAVADSSRRHLRIPAGKITVIPRARPAPLSVVDEVHVREAVRTSLGMPTDARVILTVGRQEYQKGHVHLIRAFSLLSVRHPEAWLVIAGREGNASTAIQEATERANGSNRILCLGHRGDVRRLLIAADIFAFPSLYEGLGGALLEAMAAGVPVVGSDTAATREVAGDAVLYSPPAAEGELASNIERLLNDPELRAEVAEKAAERYSNWPTMDEVADGLVHWYRRCVGGGTA